MPASNERRIIIDTSTILKVIGVFLVLWFAYLVRDILALLFVSLFLAAIMNPAAVALTKVKIPKGVTVIMLYIVLLGLGVLTIGLLLPTLIDQSANLLRTLGISGDTISSTVQWLQRFSPEDLRQNIEAGMQLLNGGQFSGAASAFVGTVTNVFGGLIGLIVVLVMAFYMVVQEQDARDAFKNFVPEDWQESISAVLKRVQEKISRWLVGQLSLCLIIGLFYYIGLSIIGLHAALLLALWGGFTEFIPYLGPILGAIPALLIALSISPVMVALTFLVIFIIQEAEGHIIVPKVMQKAVGLNPLVSITALLVGAKLYGIVGALLAIPVATAVSVVLSELYRIRTARR